MSGVIYWTTDIGGYAGGVCGAPDYDELIVRWYQWGAFCSVFRTHGRRGHCENEIWEYGNASYEAIKEVVLMRKFLSGYVRNAWRTAARDGTPVMRPLFWDYSIPHVNNNTIPSPHSHVINHSPLTTNVNTNTTPIITTDITTDTILDVHDIDDQMLFGDRLLVAPQFQRLSEGGGSRLVFLPALNASERWRDWWSNKTVNTSEAQWVRVQTPLNRFGLFERVRV